jgi:prephenate dehydrogenase
MKKLEQISVIGTGLLGASVTLAAGQSLPEITTVAYSHRPVTRRKARRLGIADIIVDDITKCVETADIVILATPVSAFEQIFRDIANLLPDGCIVTDVGSTKALAHRWAKNFLAANVSYIGSHPIAGSEKRGVEFARDDLFFGARCILTKTANSNQNSLRTLRHLWSSLGCAVSVMTPPEHDRIFARISHLPHVLAAALINAGNPEQLKFAGKGFIDSSRIASGPANVWTDILITNSANISKSIEAVIRELRKLQRAVSKKNRNQIEKLIDRASSKRAALIKYKMRKNELL